jgi:hypothetical protein
MKRFFQSLFGQSNKPRRTSSPNRRAQLGVEQLDGRLLPSATGLISSITDAYGQTSCFVVGTDGGVYASLDHFGYTKLSGGSGWFTAVSAGLDSNGHAECWAENSNGDLWWFSGYASDQNNFSLFPQQPVYGRDEGHLGGGEPFSAGRHGDCFAAVGNGIYVYGLGGTWQRIIFMSQGYGPTQLSAGVDSSGNDQVYVLTQPGYIEELNQNGGPFNWSHTWLTNQWGNYVLGTQISASISSNNDGAQTDFFFVNKADGTLHDYYNGYDVYMGGAGQIHQICAATNANGDYCVAIVDDYSHFSEVYAVGFWTGWTDLQNQADYIAAAGDGMIFTIEKWPDQRILCHDPNNDWANAWGGIDTPWHYTGGTSF